MKWFTSNISNFKIHLCCSPIVIFSKQISIYLEAEEYLPMKITHSDEIIKLIMYTAFNKSKSPFWKLRDTWSD